MPGKRAGVAREQRHEGVPGQAEAAEHPVHHEGRARQVAGVLEQADQEEEQADLRQEDDRAGDAADEPADQQVAHRAGRQLRLEKPPRVREGRLDEVHRDGGEREERPEQRRHHQMEDQQAERPDG